MGVGVLAYISPLNFLREIIGIWAKHKKSPGAIKLRRSE